MRQKFLLRPIFLSLCLQITAKPIVQVKISPEGAKSVAVEIPENADLGTLLVDMKKIFKFPGIERIFSLQSSDAELVKVTENGEVKLDKPVDFEKLCVPSQLCAFESKVKNIQIGWSRLAGLMVMGFLSKIRIYKSFLSVLRNF